MFVANQGNHSFANPDRTGLGCRLDLKTAARVYDAYILLDKAFASLSVAYYAAVKKTFQNH